MRVRLAQDFGWDFDYIDSLSQQDVNDVFAVLAAQNRLKEEVAQRGKRH